MKKRFTILKSYKYVKPRSMTALLLVFIMAVSVFAGCKKGEDTASNTGVLSTSSGTASRTTTTGAAKSSITAADTSKATQGSASATKADDKVTTDATSEGSNSSETNVISEGTDISNEPTDASDGFVEETKKYDLNGREIKIIASGESQILTPDSTTKVNQVMYKLMKEAEENFNCKFVFELNTAAAQLREGFEAAMLAGVYFADIIRFNRTVAFPKYEREKLILPLNDYIDFNQPVMQQYDHVTGILNPDNVYSFYILTPLVPMAVFYNRALTEKDGIPEIHTIADEGNWSWETLLDIAIKTTHDFNGDGLIDQWGLGAESTNHLCYAFLRANLSAMIAPAEKGRYVYNLQNPKALKALRFVSDLIHTYYVTPPRAAKNDFLTGNLTMYIGANASVATSFTSQGMTNMGLEIVPPGPDNPGKYYMRELGSHMFFFASNIKDPEAVVNAAAWWLVPWDESKSDYVTFDDMNLSNAQKWFGALDNSEVEVSRFMEIIRTYTQLYEYSPFFSAASSLIASKVLNPMVNEKISPEANIEAIKYQAQDIIDSILGQQ